MVGRRAVIDRSHLGKANSRHHHPFCWFRPRPGTASPAAAMPRCVSNRPDQRRRGEARCGRPADVGDPVGHGLDPRPRLAVRRAMSGRDSTLAAATARQPAASVGIVSQPTGSGRAICLPGALGLTDDRRTGRSRAGTAAGPCPRPATGGHCRQRHARATVGEADQPSAASPRHPPIPLCLPRRCAATSSTSAAGAVNPVA